MTIIDFPSRGGRGRGSGGAGALRRLPVPGRRTSAHPAASATARRVVATPVGEPPSGLWLDAYEQLAACCAEVVAAARPRPRVYDAEWEDLLSWIRSRLAVLDDLKAPGAS